MAMKIASLKFSAKKEPPFYDVKVDDKGNIRYYNKKGERHRLDGPAVEWIDGYKEWWVNGKCHRLDGPAVEYPNGEKEWFVNGKRHRLDGPAAEYRNGNRQWWVDGEQIGTTLGGFTDEDFERWKKEHGYEE